jgi:predicted KAP-like P-loop ATPase
MNAVTRSPDDPIYSEEEDLLGRASFAEGLADLISGAPPDATLRIGVYGGWGEGKTSVLQMLQSRLAREGHCTVFLYAWASHSADELLERLLRSIARELKIPSGLVYWSMVTSLLGPLRQGASSLDAKIKAADAVLGPAIEAVFGKLKRRSTASVLQRIKSKLGDKKLVVFVDDLDRVRPDLIPEILLTLREALNQPGYYYVLALAPEVVQGVLAAANEKWGASTEFLEKIVELPRHLPPITPAARNAFLTVHLERLGVNGSIKETLQEIRELLPQNPRQAKTFLRYIASLQRLTSRLAGDEINFVQFALCQLLRSEFPTEASRLLDDEGAMDDLALARFTPGSGWSSKAPKEHDPPFLKHMPLTSNSSRRERFEHLCLEIRRRGLIGGATILRSLFLMPDEPPVLTSKECRELLEAYGANERYA